MGATKLLPLAGEGDDDGIRTGVWDADFFGLAELVAGDFVDRRQGVERRLGSRFSESFGISEVWRLGAWDLLAGVAILAVLHSEFNHRTKAEEEEQKKKQETKGLEERGRKKGRGEARVPWEFERCDSTASFHW